MLKLIDDQTSGLKIMNFKVRAVASFLYNVPVIFLFLSNKIFPP